MVTICGALMLKKAEEKVQEREEFRKIEYEQQCVTQINLQDKKREECKKMLGLDVYEKMCRCIQLHNDHRLGTPEYKAELTKLANNDKKKFNCAFIIEQTLEFERIKQI